jgi:hypothetical protein
MRALVLENPPREQSLSAPSFDRLARVYRWMEWFSFGPFLSRCRCAFLPSLKDRRSALILGDGDGRFTARLLNQNPHLIADAVDASSAMLCELNRRAASSAARLQAHLHDARSFTPVRRNYDLVVTHFFLDCLTTEEVESLAIRMRNYTTPDALWVVSEFAIPAGFYGRAIAQPLISSLYWAFGWLTGLSIRRLPRHRFALAKAGWSLQCRQKALGGLLVSELWRPDPQSPPILPR